MWWWMVWTAAAYEPGIVRVEDTVREAVDDATAVLHCRGLPVVDLQSTAKAGEFVLPPRLVELPTNTVCGLGLSAPRKESRMIDLRRAESVAGVGSESVFVFTLEPTRPSVLAEQDLKRRDPAAPFVRFQNAAPPHCSTEYLDVEAGEDGGLRVFYGRTSERCRRRWPWSRRLEPVLATEALLNDPAFYPERALLDDATWSYPTPFGIYCSNQNPGNATRLHISDGSRRTSRALTDGGGLRSQRVATLALQWFAIAERSGESNVLLDLVGQLPSTYPWAYVWPVLPPADRPLGVAWGRFVVPDQSDQAHYLAPTRDGFFLAAYDRVGLDCRGDSSSTFVCEPLGLGGPAECPSQLSATGVVEADGGVTVQFVYERSDSDDACSVEQVLASTTIIPVADFWQTTVTGETTPH